MSIQEIEGRRHFGPGNPAQPGRGQPPPLAAGLVKAIPGPATVTGLVNQIAEALGLAHERLDALRFRLSAITAKSAEAEPCLPTAPEDLASPVVRQLRDTLAGIEALSDRICATERRLDL